MPLIDNAKIKVFTVPGIRHQTVAGPEQGLKSLEVWLETIAPGAGTPLHSHDCEEVLLILKGSGRVTLGNEDTEFGPNSTLVKTLGLIHQVVNTGPEEMVLVVALNMAPAKALSPGGEPIPLPWSRS